MVKNNPDVSGIVCPCCNQFNGWVSAGKCVPYSKKKIKEERENVNIDIITEFLEYVCGQDSTIPNQRLGDGNIIKAIKNRKTSEIEFLMVRLLYIDYATKHARDEWDSKFVVRWTTKKVNMNGTTAGWRS